MPDRTEFIEAAKAAAFEIADPESSDCGRRVIHSMLGSIGADWDLEGVVDAIESASEVSWDDGHWLGHALRVVTADGRVMRFDVARTAVS